MKSMFAVAIIAIIILGIFSIYQRHQNSYQVILSTMGMSESEIRDCMTWALGKNFRYIVIGDLPEEWNARHGDLFIVKEGDYIYSVIKKIGDAYITWRKTHDYKKSDWN